MINSVHPKVSIITCFFNIGELLTESIESVLHQEYQNWELWLIDDGSTDCSSQIAKTYAIKYPDKIFYYEHEGHRNIGTSASRNIGLEKCNGELVAFLDGDDVWLPNLLFELLSLLQQHSVGMVCEATKYWYSWSRDTSQDHIIAVGKKQDCVFFPPQLMLELYPLGKGRAPCICGMLVIKDILLKHGGFETCFEGMYDDQAFLVKFYLNEAVYISSGCHNLYRQRQGSLVHTSRSTGKYLKEREFFLKWLEVYLNKIGSNEREIKRLLKNALLPYRHPLLHYIKHTFPFKVRRLIKRLSTRDAHF